MVLDCLCIWGSGLLGFRGLMRFGAYGVQYLRLEVEELLSDSRL